MIEAISEKMTQVCPEDDKKTPSGEATATIWSKFACILISMRVVPVSVNKTGNVIKMNISNF